MADVNEEEGRDAKRENGELGKREALKLMKRRNLMLKNEERLTLSRIKGILRKETRERSEEDIEFLGRYSKIANEVLKRKEKKRVLEERSKEKEDSPEILRRKCAELAEAIRCAKHMVVYTGAGISTAASIPDYRGPDGVWTKLCKGEDLTWVKHVVSQNCDGLHVRSGLPSPALSEVHGNMFAEVCEECDPQRVYWRLFDVTENTGLRRHYTNRTCHYCCNKLSDTIVHFGEKRELFFPQNWKAAFDHAKMADAILCLGSSLKVLKSYRGLWGMNRVKLKRPDLYIVNLQWTPKDNLASLKIHGKVDEVMKLVMSQLSYSIPKYNRQNDPLFRIHVPLTRYESDTHKTKLLTLKKDECNSKVKEEQKTNDYAPTVQSSISKSNCIFSSLLNEQVKEEADAVLKNVVQTNHKTATVRPGWFGKGLGKVKKRKRK
eukprot:gene6111-11501_t